MLISCYMLGSTAFTYVKTKKTTKHVLLTLTYMQSNPSISIPDLS